MHELRIEQLETELRSTQRTPPTSLPDQASSLTVPHDEQRILPSSTGHRQSRQPYTAHSTEFNMDTLQLEAPIATLRSLGAISPESANTPSLEGEGRLSMPNTMPYDPVHLGIVTTHEAQRAIHIYFQNCHPWAPFLDEELSRRGGDIRHTNPLIFLAVVCIGTQFWTKSSSPESPDQPPIHPRYFELAAVFDTAVSQLLLAPAPSDANIDSVCTLLLYSQWMPYLIGASNNPVGNDRPSNAYGISNQSVKNRYNDLSAWVVFGLAVRYASFLGLERIVTRPFKTSCSITPESAWVTRADFAQARVWLNLVTYDCNLTLTSGLPASIDPVRVEAMARIFCKHPLSQFPGDVRYSALVELACIMQKARSGERWGDTGGGEDLSNRHPSIDVLKRANLGFEDWEKHWLPKLRHTHMQHNQLPFTSLRWYQLALNSSALRRILSLSDGPAGQREEQRPEPMQVWALGALEVGLTAAAQILFSLSSGAASDVWHLSSQDPSTFPAGPFSVDQESRRSLYHGIDSIWISHAFALIFIVLCYVRGRIDDDLQICGLSVVTSQQTRAPTKPRPMSIIARLAQLALDVFECRSSCEVSEFRPIDKISTLVSNATSLVLPPPSGNENCTTAVAAETDSHTHPDPGLQTLLDLMGDSGMDWPATLCLFDEGPSNVFATEWSFG